MSSRDQKPGRASRLRPPRPSRAILEAPADAKAPEHELGIPIGLLCGGISFLRAGDDSELPEEPEWRRYVDDRLRHFTISHRAEKTQRGEATK